MEFILEIHVAFLQDAPKGYLKLLILTTESGDGANGEAIQRSVFILFYFFFVA